MGPLQNAVYGGRRTAHFPARLPVPAAVHLRPQHAAAGGREVPVHSDHDREYVLRSVLFSYPESVRDKRIIGAARRRESARRRSPMKKFLVAVAMAALSVPAFAQGAPQRIAVIDVQRVLQSSTLGKTAYERLKKMQDERVARAQKMDEEAKAL